jgi:hypothetical protein
MAINWPNIAQGTGTGTTYTSNEGYTWVWSGNKWDGVSGNSLGGFLGPWVIFNSTGSPNTYTNIFNAMQGATSGDTIHLYGNIIESAAETPLKDGVDINLNGNTATFDDNFSGNAVLNNFSNTVSCKIYN